MTGKVVRYFDEKGFGFISPDNSNDDLFFHIDDFVNRPSEIKRGMQVEFEVVQGRKGPRAHLITA